MLKDRRNDLRHAALLENSLVAPMGKTRQARSQSEMVAGESNTWVTPADCVDLPVQPCAGFAEIQVSGLVEQRLQIQGGMLTD
ncbi:hypothetical protein PFUM301598_23170 [Pseudomonas fluorescens]